MNRIQNKVTGYKVDESCFICQEWAARIEINKKYNSTNKRKKVKGEGEKRKSEKNMYRPWMQTNKC